MCLLGVYNTGYHFLVGTALGVGYLAPLAGVAQSCLQVGAEPLIKESTC